MIILGSQASRRRRDRIQTHLDRDSPIRKCLLFERRNIKTNPEFRAVIENGVSNRIFPVSIQSLSRRGPPAAPALRQLFPFQYSRLNVYSGDLGPYFGLQLRFEAHTRERGRGRGARGVSPAPWSCRRGIHALQRRKRFGGL